MVGWLVVWFVGMLGIDRSIDRSSIVALLFGPPDTRHHTTTDCWLVGWLVAMMGGITSIRAIIIILIAIIISHADSTARIQTCTHTWTDTTYTTNTHTHTHIPMGIRQTTCVFEFVRA